MHSSVCPPLIFGRPLRTDQQDDEELSVGTGVPVLGLDALASAAYGPEAALTVLIAAGPRGTPAVLPIMAAIVVVLALVFLSYLQTLEAYPNGGGSYTVAKENLGPRWGVIAATALCTDYVLNVAVAIAAGVGAVVSIVPSLLPHTLVLCLLILAVLAVVNLRGVRSAGAAFAWPTYAFMLLLGAVILVGLFGVRHGSLPRPGATATAEGLSAWLLLRAFASGCTAFTGRRRDPEPVEPHWYQMSSQPAGDAAEAGAADPWRAKRRGGEHAVVRARHEQRGTSGGAAFNGGPRA